MKCFVAMAFGDPQLDQLYEAAICGVLKKHGVTPIRVDRVEHNQNIDARIIAEIESADFAIADLTFARPSVYYEAGYAERVLRDGVIYTIRRDHLSPRAGDSMGNYRLHFDLQMKNVIDWAEPTDPVFIARLDSRVKHVTGPLVHKSAEDSAERNARAEFGALSVIVREAALVEAAASVMAECGFLNVDEVQHPIGQRAARDATPGLHVKAHTRKLTFVQIEVRTKTDEPPHLSEDADLLSYDVNLNFNHVLNDLETVCQRTIFCTLFDVSFSEVCHKMPTFAVSPEQRLLTRDDRLEVPIFDAKYTGEVFPDVHVFRDGLTGLWTGSQIHRGFLVSSIPENVSWRGHYAEGLRFVHQGFQRRKIVRRIECQILDAIDSERSFVRRLKAAVADC
jgi:hypothetical protein